MVSSGNRLRPLKTVVLSEGVLLKAVVKPYRTIGIEGERKTKVEKNDYYFTLSAQLGS